MRNGDPFSPEHFVTYQAVLADTYVINPNTDSGRSGRASRAGSTRAFRVRWAPDEAKFGLPSYFYADPGAERSDGFDDDPRYQRQFADPEHDLYRTLLGQDKTYR